MKIRLLANVAKPQLPAVANRTAWKIPVGLFVPMADWRSRPTGSGEGATVFLPDLPKLLAQGIDIVNASL